MKFWGITGTNGKTTTTWIFAEFVNACPGRTCGYLTTVEVNTGTRRFYTGYTTPPLAQLKEIFAEMEANGCTDCVMEVSSHAIHQHRTGDTVFSGGAFTNLSEDHLDYHKTMEAYFDVKLDFARQIAAQREKREAEGNANRAPFVVCLDGGYGREMFDAVGKLPLNVIAATVGSSDPDGRARAPRAPQPDYDLSRLPLAGAYNRSNVLTAAALAEAAGVPRETIQRVIPTLKPRWGRLELVENPNVPATVYVDFAHTPDGLEKVLSAVRSDMEKSQIENCKLQNREAQGRLQSREARGRLQNQEARGRLQNQEAQSNNQTIKQSNNSLWVVFGAGGDRDPMKRPLMGAACARLADRLVVTSDNPRSEDPMKIIEAILAGVHSVYGNPNTQTPKHSDTVIVEPDRAKAIAYALTHAKAGDVVVIAGKGHETTQEIAGVRHPFDDRAVVRAFCP